jgi:hypothetical protein
MFLEPVLGHTENVSFTRVQEKTHLQFLAGEALDVLVYDVQSPGLLRCPRG